MGIEQVVDDEAEDRGMGNYRRGREVNVEVELGYVRTGGVHVCMSQKNKIVLPKVHSGHGESPVAIITIYACIGMRSVVVRTARFKGTRIWKYIQLRSRIQLFHPGTA